MPVEHAKTRFTTGILARMVIVAGALGSGACVAPLAPAAKGRSGEQVYQQVCMSCHATKVENAPQFGDRAAWKPLIEEGQDVLTAHAWVGVRGMPPRGGSPDLRLDEFARATAYMARAAGADWADPDARMLEKIDDEIEDRLENLEAGKEEKP